MMLDLGGAFAPVMVTSIRVVRLASHLSGSVEYAADGGFVSDLKS